LIIGNKLQKKYELMFKGKSIWKTTADFIKSGAYIKKHPKLGTDKLFYKLMTTDNRPLMFVTKRTFNLLIKHRRIQMDNKTGYYVMNPVWRKVRKDKKKKVLKRAPKKKEAQLSLDIKTKKVKNKYNRLSNFSVAIYNY